LVAAELVGVLEDDEGIGARRVELEEVEEELVAEERGGRDEVDAEEVVEVPWYFDVRPVEAVASLRFE